MAAIVGIDAKIELKIDVNGTPTWTELPERNEFSISIKVDTAEHKVFVESLDKAWANKKRTWMSWSGSLSGYFDSADDTIFKAVLAGEEIDARFYDTRDAVLGTKAWQGKILLTNVEHTTGTDDYSTLNVDFEGQGILAHDVVQEEGG
jgi:hypothetical protein